MTPWIWASAHELLDMCSIQHLLHNLLAGSQILPVLVQGLIGSLSINSNQPCEIVSAQMPQQAALDHVPASK